MKKIGIGGILLVVCSLVFAGGVQEEAPVEEQYPTRPVTLIVPYNAGAGTDTTARMIAQKLEQIIGQPVPILNMGGASGGIGMSELMRSEPDGYTMALDLVNIWTRKALNTSDFGPEAFESIAECGSYYLVEVARQASQFTTLKEFYDSAKQTPDSVAIATNIGAIIHFVTLAMMDGTGAQPRLVHIGDGAQRITSVLGGHVETTIMGTQEVLPYYTSNDMKVLAVYAPERVLWYPEVPTAKEQGFDVVQANFYWFFMPKGTPAERVNFMADALEQVMRDPEIIQRMVTMGMTPTYFRGAELQQRIDAEGKKLMDLAQRHNLGK